MKDRLKTKMILFLLLEWGFHAQALTLPCHEALRAIGRKIEVGQASDEDIKRLPALIDQVYREMDDLRKNERRLAEEGKVTQEMLHKLKDKNDKLELIVQRALDSGFGVKGAQSKLALEMALEDRYRDLKPGESVGIIHLDLDGLKAINDLGGGHRGGDAVIRSVLEGLTKNLRWEDDYDVFRPSGDEIVILIKHGWKIKDVTDRINKKLPEIVSDIETRLEAVRVESLKGVAGQLSQDSALMEAKLRDSDDPSRQRLLSRWSQGKVSITGAAGQTDPRIVYESFEDFKKALWAPDEAVAKLKKKGGRGKIHIFPMVRPYFTGDGASNAPSPVK